MNNNEHINIIKDSQILQKKLIIGVFDDYEELIANNTPKETEDIVVYEYGEDLYDCIEVRIDTDAQTAFFTIAQSINPICDFWYFLESIIIGNEISYWYQNQEGPKVCLVVSKLNDEKIRVSLISEGWWEFNKNQKGLKEIYNDDYQITLDTICSKREFITKIYTMMINLKYSNPEEGYDPWYDVLKDSKIINEYISKVNAPIIRDEQNTLNNEIKFSIDWTFGVGNINNDNIETDSSDDIENTLHNIWQYNDDLLQIAVLYNCNDTRVCHTMELCEIKWIENDLLEKVKNNENAKYFDSHCSCDFEFVTTVIDEQHIRLIITDQNNESKMIFDEVISKDEFLIEVSRVFNEIKRKVDKIVEEYGNKNNLSNKEKEELKTRMYEW